ncbi:hypothetical protein FOCC_FOCC006690 [Frankliniella occidentalis]|nr:hypothetical protein FOCC_FOCC006690 [Frankliniella occidentalis]
MRAPFNGSLFQEVEMDEKMVEFTVNRYKGSSKSKLGERRRGVQVECSIRLPLRRSKPQEVSSDYERKKIGDTLTRCVHRSATPPHEEVFRELECLRLRFWTHRVMGMFVLDATDTNRQQTARTSTYGGSGEQEGWVGSTSCDTLYL